MKKITWSVCMLAIIVLTGGCGNRKADNTSADKADNNEKGNVSKTVGADTVTDTKKESYTNSGTDAETVEETLIRSEDMFTARDYEVGYEETESAVIRLNGNSAVCSSDAVRILGTTITITEEGTYILTGTLNDGMVIVDAEDTDKLQLVLKNASIHSETCAPVYIRQADKVFLTLAADTANTLSNGGEFAPVDENTIDAVIFSKQDLTLNGSGSLTVSSPAGHGITVKDDLVFTSGTYTIQAANHGIDANDSVRVTNAALTVTAGKDGIHAENSDDTGLGFVYMESGMIQVHAQGDGLSAGAYMQIEGGSFDITSGGLKGMKAGGRLAVLGGTFVIHSADDAIHSNTSIIVSGGTFEIASGDDAFHADEMLTVTDGIIYITESYEGLEALHIKILGGEIAIVATDDGINAAGGTDQSGYVGDAGNDRFRRGGRESNSSGSILISGGMITVHAGGDGLDANGTLDITGGVITVSGPVNGDTAVLDYDVSASITGGTFIGTGAIHMALTFSASDQGVISVSTGIQSAGTRIAVTDADGRVMLSYEPDQSFAIAILSSPEIVKGETYTVTVGSSSGDFVAE